MNIFSLFLSGRKKRVRDLVKIYMSINNAQLSELERLLIVAGECHLKDGKMLKDRSDYSPQYMTHAKELIYMACNVKIDEVDIRKLIHDIVSWEFPCKERLSVESIRDANSEYNKSEREIDNAIDIYLGKGV